MYSYMGTNHPESNSNSVTTAARHQNSLGNNVTLPRAENSANAEGTPLVSYNSHKNGTYKLLTKNKILFCLRSFCVF